MSYKKFMFFGRVFYVQYSYCFNLRTLKFETMEKGKIGLTAAILIANGFTDSEVLSLTNKLNSMGIELTVLSPEEKLIKSASLMNSELESGIESGLLIDVDINIESINNIDFDMLIIPGGAFHIYKLITNAHVLKLVRQFAETHRILCTSSHAIELLLETGSTRGKYLTSPVRYKAAIMNSGGQWLNENVVEDSNLITGKNSGQVSAFSEKIVDKALRFNMLKKYSSARSKKMNAV